MKISHFITKAVAPVLSALLAVGVLFAFARTAVAQGDVDPPGRVARLNYAQGSVSFQPAGTKDWVDASPNRPLTTGDNLWSDDNSRGELHVGSTALRLSSQTGISFLNLNDQATQIQLAQGSLFLHVRELDENEAFEVDTPNIAFSILRPGTYRVTVDPDGNSTFVDVRSGGGEVTGGGSAYNLNPGQRYSFTGSDQLNYNTQGLPGRDDFDNWSASRDQREERSVSARYVSRDVMGYEDLDAYGSWSQDPEYGAVWMPRGVGAGWAPYHDGHWVYVDPWGWTWVGAEPWGFAPYHYGRWSVIRGSWGWIPGPVAVVVIGRPILRPVYAPALVGFVGGGGFSVSLVIGGGAGVAWFPLGPRDVWVPSYRCSPTYVQNVNIRNTRVVNVTQVTNVYNNVYINHNTTVVNNYTYANNVRAVTAVSRTTFVSGQNVGRASVRVTEDQIRNPRVAQGAPALEPTRQSRLGPNAISNRIPPATLANRAVVTKMAPAPQVVPIGQTQSFGNSGGGFRPGATRGSNRPGAPPNPNSNQAPNGMPNAQPNSTGRPGALPPAGSAPNPNATGNGNVNPNGQPNNSARPGFQRPPGNNPGAPGNVNPNAQPNNSGRPATQPPSGNNPSTTGGGNSNAQPSNTARPGFQRPPGNNPGAPGNVNPNAQPNNSGRPATQPPSGNNPSTTGGGNSNAQPSNTVRPGFQRPPGNNPDAPGNVNPNAQPNNSGRPAFQPPSHNNPNTNENGNSNAQPNRTPQDRRQIQPPPKPPNPPKESKAEQDKRKQQEKDQKDHQQ